MSKRRDNCDHDHWEILPGNNIRCPRCGETISDEEVMEWVNNEDAPPVTLVTVEGNRMRPLTYTLRDLT